MSGRTRSICAGLTCFGVLVAAGGGGVAGASQHARMTALPGFSARASGASRLGAFTRSAMSVEVVLTPNHQRTMNHRLAAMYRPGSGMFHRWLKRGQFQRLYAPSAARVSRVTRALRVRGLSVHRTSSPFLLRATGSSGQLGHAFDTRLIRYRSANGTAFHANSSALRIPSSIARDVQGVVGMSNTFRIHPAYRRADAAASTLGHTVPQYGAGPKGSGLSPQQVRSIYSAGVMFDKGPRGQGTGVVSAVFELSGYTRPDVTVFAHQFLGTHYRPPLRDVNVDGGPIHPNCPAHDHCFAHDFSGDIEVEIDIEAQLGMAPALKQLIVYNAPNDFTGQTTVDQYLRIARDDLADTISSSWGLCEPDSGLGVIRAESIAFTQMAMQGQSITSASGDSGAFDCLLDGPPNAHKLTVDDPTSQPLVTGVGGTSFTTFDPGRNQHPSYPGRRETVWNPHGACAGTPRGFNGCNLFGAGGGGVSQVWGRPGYQSGPGVQSSFSRKGCLFAAAGRWCREVPDVSANADELTPYAEFCTGNPATNSSCAIPPTGWFGIGGTSVSSPVWAGILADTVSLAGGHRIGNANWRLYGQLRNHYARGFHDISGIHQFPNDNGHFPVTPNYDMSTGIGTPRISALTDAIH
jgi:subtilase family serine protease